MQIPKSIWTSLQSHLHLNKNYALEIDRLLKKGQHYIRLNDSELAL